MWRESASSLEALAGPEIDGALGSELINPSPVVKNYEVVVCQLPEGGWEGPFLVVN